MVRIRIDPPAGKRSAVHPGAATTALALSRSSWNSCSMALEQPAPRWEHIGIYNVAARLRLLDARCRVVVRSRPGRGTAVILYLPLVENEEEFEE